MAEPSEQISTKWIEGAERICIKCGKEIKNLARDVGVVRSRSPGSVREIICMDCHTGRTNDDGDQGTASS